MARSDQTNPYETPQSEQGGDAADKAQLALDRVSFDDEASGCRFATSIDDRDVVAALRVPLKRLLVRSTIMLLIGSLMLLAYFTTGDGATLALFLWIAVLYPGWVWWLGRRAGYRYLRKFPQATGPMEGYVSPSRLFVKTDRGETELLLPGLTHVRETPDYLVLSFHSAQATVVVLPRRAFAPGDYPRAAGFVRRWHAGKTRRPLVVDRRLSQPPEYPPSTPPDGGITFEGDVMAEDVRASAFGEQLRKIERRWLIPLAAAELLLIVVAVGGLLRWWRIPSVVGGFLLIAIIFGFTFLIAIVRMVRSFRKPNSVLWNSQGWIHSTGVAVGVSFVRIRHKWSAFESCSADEEAIALRLPGTACQFVFLGRKQFGSDLDWKTACELADRNFPRRAGS